MTTSRRSILRAAAGLSIAGPASIGLAGRAMAHGGEAPAPAAEVRALDMPILIYHHTKPGPEPRSAAEQIMTVTPETFERQLRYLKDNGYQTISFADLAAYMETKAAVPERPAIISFDDGWENQFTYAFPLLQKYDYAATFFVVSDYLDHQNFMTTDQLKQMRAAGMEIGSHTRSHPTLPAIGTQRQWSEIAGSKAILEDRLGMTIDSFAYPYGAYNREVVALTRAAGYRAARTVDMGSHYTPADLITLSGLIFARFASRNALALASGQVQR